jgi:hypothetical protein
MPEHNPGAMGGEVHRRINKKLSFFILQEQ